MAKQVKLDRTMKSNESPSFTSGFLKQLKEILTTALIVWIITAALIEGSHVPTGSMENTIKIGDFLLINKFIYGASTPRYIPLTNIQLPFFQLPAVKEPGRNDIIVFQYPGDRDKLAHDKIEFYVKRCIGVPGDKIEIDDKVVIVNDVEFTIPYNIRYIDKNILPDGYSESTIFPKGAKWNGDNYGPFVLPRKDDVIKLTLKNIEQWRTIIDREYEARVVSVKGDAILIDGVPADEYKIKKDYYFMMGDNRDDSADSRYWGLVPRDKIVGKPIVVLWSWNSEIPFSQPFKKLGSIRWDRIAKLVK